MLGGGDGGDQGGGGTRARFLRHVRELEVGRREASEEVVLLRAEVAARRASHEDAAGRLWAEAAELQQGCEREAAQAACLRSELGALDAQRSGSRAAAARGRCEILEALGLGPEYFDGGGGQSKDIGFASAAVVEAEEMRWRFDEHQDASGALRGHLAETVADRDALVLRLRAVGEERDRTAEEAFAAWRRLDGARAEMVNMEARCQGQRQNTEEARFRAIVEAEACDAERERQLMTLQESTARARRLEQDEETCFRREEAWRADFAARVHQAFLDGAPHP